jgi:hypothetical protein
MRTCVTVLGKGKKFDVLLYLKKRIPGGGQSVGGLQACPPDDPAAASASSEARFAASPVVEASKPDSADAMYPRLQLFLTIQQLFQALDGVFQAMRCTATALPVAAHAASTSPATLKSAIPASIFCGAPHARIFI